MLIMATGLRYIYINNKMLTWRYRVVIYNKLTGWSYGSTTVRWSNLKDWSNVDLMLGQRRSFDKNVHDLYHMLYIYYLHHTHINHISCIFTLALTWLNVDRNLEVLPSAHIVNGAKISWKYIQFWYEYLRDIYKIAKVGSSW